MQQDELQVFPQSAPAPCGEADAQSARLPQRRGLTGTHLKIIAIVLMLIDHIGATVMQTLTMQTQSNALLFATTLMRYLGRLAFPIFCFLLVEGFLHTRDVKKYILRLAAFAVLSEIPFDFAISGTWLEFTHQNVFFTLTIGVVALLAIRNFSGRVWLQVLCAGACVVAAELLHTDYAGMGVIVILLFYTLREHRRARFWAVGLWLFLGMALSGVMQFAAVLAAQPELYSAYPPFVLLINIAISCTMSGLMEACGAFSFLLIRRYNGARGAGLPKYFFYAFYPAHLLLLGLMTQMVLRFTA
ncbi:MAG: TraX family protein [Ruthenibacterium sp.]